MTKGLWLAAALFLIVAAPVRADMTIGDWSLAIVDGATGETLTVDELKARVASADIVLLGEIHDNGPHHVAQGLALSWMFEAGPGTVVFEMLKRDKQDVVDAFDGTADSFGPAVSWEEGGWPSADLYMPVFEATIASGSRIIASDLPRESLMALYGDGADALESDVRTVYDLLDPIPAETQDAMLEIQFSAHCELMPRDKMAGMVTVQRARDAALAESVIQAHRAGDGPVALIAGAGHVRDDHGTGVLVRRALPDASVLTIGLTEADEWDSEAILDRMARFDVLWITPAAERPDPCEDLRRRLTGE